MTDLCLFLLTACGASCSDTSHTSSEAFGRCFSENLLSNEMATDSADTRAFDTTALMVFWLSTTLQTQIAYIAYDHQVLSMVAEWSKVLIAVCWPFIVGSTLAVGTYQLRFISWVFHVIFSFVYFIS